MKSRIAKSLTIAALAAALAACSSVPLDDKAGQGGGAGQGSSASGQILDPFNPQSILAQQRSVYFDFDSYTVSDQYRGLVETHAKYLASHQQQKIKIEGNTDERGGAEYNQIETISFGKEKPRSTGTTEADFAENRRADINYLR